MWLWCDRGLEEGGVACAGSSFERQVNAARSRSESGGGEARSGDAAVTVRALPETC